MSKPDFKHQTFDIIQQLTGHENLITLNVAFVDFVGDLEGGLFLSQLIYWADRGTRKDGYIYKTAKEWYEEIRLTQYAVTKSTKKLKEMGLLETKLKKANGNPTTHYKLNKEEFVRQFTWFLRKRKIELTKTEEGTDDNENSLTDITSYIPSDITKKNKGTEKIPSYTFFDFKNKFNIDKYTSDVIEYYLDLYFEHREQTHPKLKEEQWNYVVENLFMVDDMEMDDTDMMDMIEQHFKTKYKDCDYNILHFMSEGVKRNRMYEVAYY